MKKLFFMVCCMLAVNVASTDSAKANDNFGVETSMDSSQESKVVHLTKTEFLEKVYNYEKNPGSWMYEGDKPAIVDFYADWCGPCKMVAPILEDLAVEYAGQIVVYKVNTDSERELAAAFGINSIPSLLFIPLTGTPQMAQGAMPKAELKRAVEEVLLGGK